MGHLLHSPGYVLAGYAVYVLWLGLFFYLLGAGLRGRLGGLKALAAYVCIIAAVGGLRTFWEFRFTDNSLAYAVRYWTTEFLLVSSAFLLICTFFRRAALGGAPRLWPHIRVMLFSIFFLTGAVAFFVVLHHHARFFPFFVLEFAQDLYFVCMVLTTMLYLMMLQHDAADDQLGLLVAGLGIYYAGAAASLALVHLAHLSSQARVIYAYLGQLPELGMILTWFYAAARVPYRVAAREVRRAPRPARVGQLVEIS